MKPQNIAVCTTTFYPRWEPTLQKKVKGQVVDLSVEDILENGDQTSVEHKIRGDLAIKFALNAQRKGYKLVLIEGSGPPHEICEFRAELLRLGIPYLPETEKGMSGSRRQAFNAAFEDAEIRAIAWAEPEKVKMINELDACIQPIERDEAAMVIPGRDWIRGWPSLPSYQKQSERRSNHIFNMLLHRAGLLNEQCDLDVFFGPRVFSAMAQYRSHIKDILNRQYVFDKTPHGTDEQCNEHLAKLYEIIKPGAYSEATFFPIIAALHEGLPVRGKETQFFYPWQQRTLEEHPAYAPGYRRKRITQSIGIDMEEYHYLRMIGRLPGISRLRRAA